MIESRPRKQGICRDYGGAIITTALWRNSGRGLPDVEYAVQFLLDGPARLTGEIIQVVLAAADLGGFVDRVIIKDLVARGIIGVNDSEREKPQDILINIVAFTDTREAARTDDLANSVNYRTLAQKARAHAETAARFTVEALAADLAELCLEDRAVSRVIVRVEKPGAVRFSSSVGVEIDRSRDEAAA